MNRLFSHFRTKLLLAFFVCTIIPLTIIGIISYKVSYTIASDKITESAILASDQVKLQLNNRFSQVERVADAVQYDMYSLNHSSKRLSEDIDALTSLRNNIFMFKSTFDFYHICIFFPDNRFGSQEGLFFYPLEDMEKFELTKKEVKYLGSSSLWVTRPGISLPFILASGFSSADTIICCRAMHNQGSGVLEYAYFIILDTAEIKEVLSASFKGTPVCSYILSPDGYIIAHSSLESSNTYIPQSRADWLYSKTDSAFFDGNTYYQVTALSNGWRQVTEIPGSYIKNSTNVLLRSIIITLLIALPFIFIVIFLFSRSLTKRLTALSAAMESYRLSPAAPANMVSLSRPRNPGCCDEIDKLGVTFEQMLHTIDSNLQSVLDLSLSEERLKYQLLQSQINPHFLYNILGSIQNCMLIGKLDTANLMITDLTRFYRLTLRKSGELIRIRDELEIAVLYLNMEKLCHSNTLDWDIKLEDGIENFMICKFTLQPFLENSIHHGISEITPSLHISITASYGDDTVMITIQDNGAGLSPKQLNELKTSLKTKSVNYEKHFGISNVNARIGNELYGNGHVDIESRPYRQTTVTIEFAQMEGEL